MLILACDPGQNTGFTLYDSHDHSTVSWQHFYGLDGHLQFQSDLKRLLTFDSMFLCERFLFLHENQARTKIDFTPAEYIGVAKYHCQQSFTKVVWQNAAQACGASAFWGDDAKGGTAKIKQLGLWQPGKTHAMDSLRHLLYYVSFVLNDTVYLERLKKA